VSVRDEVYDTEEGHGREKEGSRRYVGTDLAREAWQWNVSGRHEGQDLHQVTPDGGEHQRLYDTVSKLR